MLLPLLLACSRPDPAPLVLLLSWDTTRADALSCYGQPDARTPVADALAARGVRFDMALAQSPTTLASHTTIMTGLDTHGHAVVRNGFPAPADVPLLAERFSAAGWDTLAVVSAFPLESDMGLDRGFRVYEDHAMLGLVGEFAVPADATTDDALDLIDARRPGAPVFLFVHYFDAHRPWTRAPERLRQSFVDPNYAGPAAADPAGMQFLTDAAMQGRLSVADRRQARGLYLAEVAWMDENLGRLLDGLDERGMLDDSLVVLLADHGEVLDEIPERPYRHGEDVDLSAIRVPLILAGQGSMALPQGTAVDRQVRLQDVGATVLSIAGLDASLGQGEDLSPLWQGHTPTAPPAYCEATRPHEATTAQGWPNRLLERSVAADDYFLTRTPYRAEQTLFRLSVEQPVIDDPAPTAALSALLDAWDARAPGHRQAHMSPETREALEALGYLEE